jgi:phosphate transport system substrate-binding protein
MKPKGGRVKTWKSVVLSMIVFIVGSSLQSSADAAETAVIRVDGSSTVFPITEAVAEEFQRSTPGHRVTVGISGTGGGFKKFCRGETDVQDASRPITPSEMEACRTGGVKYYELPVAYEGMAIVVNPQNSWLNSISVAELKKMWEPAAQGQVTRWKQINPAWPDAPLKLFGPGSDSGTFDYFTEVIVGKAKASRGDYTASEDDNTLVQGVARDKHALGYIPFAYYEANRTQLKLVGVDGGNGPILPSRETVEEGTYQPLSRPLFIYVNHDSVARPEVKQFVEYYLTNASPLIAQIKYVPLPASAYQTALHNFRTGKLGTAFHGVSSAGLKMDEMLRREAKF